MKTKMSVLLSGFLLSFLVACGVPPSGRGGSGSGVGVGVGGTPQQNSQQCTKKEFADVATCLKNCGTDGDCQQKCLQLARPSCITCISTWTRCNRQNNCGANQAGCCDAEYTACFGPRPSSPPTQPPVSNDDTGRACRAKEDCQAGCLQFNDGRGYCTKECQSKSECATGFTCAFWESQNINICAKTSDVTP